MILETNKDIELELWMNKDMVNNIWYSSITLYTDYFDLYSILMTLIYKWHNRIVINSAVSFFIHMRNYILFSDDIKFNHELMSKHFDKVLVRFMLLLKKSNQVIYLYKCNLEVKEFCEYYNFNYKVIESRKELESLTRNII